MSANTNPAARTDVFICYADADYQEAMSISYLLENTYGWTCSLMTNDTDILTKRINNSTVFILFSSENAAICQHVQLAISHATALEKKRFVVKSSKPQIIYALDNRLRETLHKKHIVKRSSFVDGTGFKSLNLIGPKSLVFLSVIIIAAIFGAMTSNIFAIQGNHVEETAGSTSSEQQFSAPLLTARIGAFIAMPSEIVAATIQARLGDPADQYNLGTNLLNMREYSMAMHWFRQSADQDYINAYAALSLMYQNGRGTEVDIDQAVKWAYKAAENGHVEMQISIAWRYFNGDGQPQSYLQAAYWLTQAARQDHTGAQVRLGIMNYFGDGIPINQKQAAYWYRRAALLNNSAGQMNLGIMYAQGHGMPQCFEQSAYWFRQAAVNGNAGAMVNLGWQYENGLALIQSYENAAYWYQKAADLGDYAGQHNIGTMYQRGVGVPQDYERAAYWYRRAVNQNSVGSASSLAALYKVGAGVEQCYSTATHLFMLAAVNGCEFSNEALAQLTEDLRNRGYQLSYRRGIRELAAELGWTEDEINQHFILIKGNDN